MPGLDSGSMVSTSWAYTIAIVLVTGVVLAQLFQPRIRDSDIWRATVTPLASIIGSGFLVIAPLLGLTVGVWATVAISGVLFLAFLVGAAIRYNIEYIEPLTEATSVTGSMRGALVWMGEAAKLILAAAYIIAVAFYLELLGAFLLRLFGLESQIAQKAIASSLLVLIGVYGWLRGLRSLETLEEYSVNVKLAIIMALLVALLIFNGELALTGSWQSPNVDPTFDMEALRTVLGAFLIVQGFETSRYLRGEYSANLRIRTMRYGQLIAAGIYLGFIAMATTLFDSFEGMSETGVIDLSAQISQLLPWLLVVGAVMSQFSAAVADTIGSGGLVEEASSERISRRVAYLGVATISLGLLWSTDIFSIIAYASRAFALYYALQCLMAAVHALSPQAGGRKLLQGFGFALLVMAMLAIVFFAIPAETVTQQG